MLIISFKCSWASNCSRKRMRAPQRSPISRKRHEGGPWSALSPLLGASPSRGPERSTPFPSLFSLVTPRSSGLLLPALLFIHSHRGREQRSWWESWIPCSSPHHFCRRPLGRCDGGGGGEEASRVAAIVRLEGLVSVCANCRELLL